MTWKLAFVYFPSLLFLLCVSLGLVKCDYSNFQIGQFQFVVGAWIASVCHSVLCLSMGTLWGGCDDASGPVLVGVKTNSFRKSQSPPLGGAIPSAVSPKEADTLEYREMVQGANLNNGFVCLFFMSCDLWKCKLNTTQMSLSLLLLLLLCSMLNLYLVSG